MIVYEWDVETVTSVDSDEYEKGEVLSHDHRDTYAQALRVFNDIPDEGCEHLLVLVRDECDIHGSVIGRSWAYIKDGRLPENFEDAYQRYEAKVPQRFHKEVEKENRK